MNSYQGKIAFFAGVLAALVVGWVVFPRVLYRRAAQPLQFSHRVHAGEKVGLQCTECHAVREDGTFSGIPNLDKCAGCHSAPVTNSPDEKILVEQYVTPNRNIPWLVYARQPENVHFSHAFHVNLAKIECQRCHPNHSTSDKLRPFEQDRVSQYSRDIKGDPTLRLVAGRKGMTMDDCSRCHRERGVEDSCLDCHK